MSVPSRAARFTLALAALATLGALLAGDATPSERALFVRTPFARNHARGATTPIQHVVVIVMENRTVDNLFAGYHGNWPGVNLADPNSAKHPLREISLATRWDPDHTHKGGFVTEFQGGQQHGWGDEDFVCPRKGCDPDPTALAYVNPAEVVPYVSMAQNFAFADDVFQASEGPSLPAHQYLIAGQSGGLTNEGKAAGFSEAENPGRKAGQTIEGPQSEDASELRKPGCAGHMKTRFVNMKTPYPGDESFKSRACMDYSTIFDLADQHFGRGQKNWRYFTSDYSIWSAPLWVDHLYRAYRNHSGNVTPGDNGVAFMHNLSSGDLPPLTFIMPCFRDSDHPLSSSTSGPLWSASIANAIGASKFWDSTAVFLVWDDWGGWYDHVQTGHPTNNAYGNPRDPYEWGFRVPLIAMSPYITNRGYVDHTPRSYSAILRFIETNFNLGSLGGDDSINDDLSSLFDYQRAPLPWIPIPVGKFRPSKGCH